MERILLVGGNSLAVTTSREFIAQGHFVLHSAATNNHLSFPKHPLLYLRHGLLDLAGFCDLITKQNITLLVDASHPFATLVQNTCFKAAKIMNIPYQRVERPSIAAIDCAKYVANHSEAAQLACSLAQTNGGIVLLTTGSKNLLPYTMQARKHGILLYARILPDHNSVRNSLEQGINFCQLIIQRGPFTVNDNFSTIVNTGATILVSKDSGYAGGVLEKAEACRRTGCTMVLIKRPN